MDGEEGLGVRGCRRREIRLLAGSLHYNPVAVPVYVQFGYAPDVAIIKHGAIPNVSIAKAGRCLVAAET